MGKKQSVFNPDVHYNVVHRTGRVKKMSKRLAVMFFFEQHCKRCIDPAKNVILQHSISEQTFI